MSYQKSDALGIKTPQYHSDEKLLDRDLMLLSEFVYKNTLDLLLAICGRSSQSADLLLDGLALTVSTGMTCSLSPGAAIGCGGKYFNVVGDWGYIADAAAHYLALNPADVSLSFDAGDTLSRVDLLEVRPLRTEYLVEPRDFRDPITGDVATNAVTTQVIFSLETQIKKGSSSGVAPSHTAGWIKIAEITVPGGATSLVAANIKGPEASSSWTNEASATVGATLVGKLSWGVDDETKDSASNIPLGTDLTSLNPTGGTASSLDKDSTVVAAIQALFTRLIDLSGVGNGSVLTRHLADSSVTAAKMAAATVFADNLDDLLHTGYYRITSAATQGPVAATAGYLDVSYVDTNTCRQIVVYDDGTQYTRFRIGGVWGTWLVPTPVPVIWSSTRMYSMYDIVNRLGAQYKSLTNSNINHDPLTDDGTNWAPVQAKGSALTNYITNPDFETNISGWNTYNDGASATPVDGTGGTSILTLARNQTAPLFDKADMTISKPASNVQGQGWSTDFTIDRGAVGSTLAVSFMFRVASGTYADNDVGVYLYDVTNGAFIPVSMTNLVGAGGGGNTAFLATFFPSASLSYRLILHIQSTSAAAYLLEMDNVSVGPKDTVMAIGSGNLQPFTPTGSLTTNVAYSGFRQSDGIYEEFLVRLTFSGPNTQSTLVLNMPPGLTIDTSKFIDTKYSPLGFGGYGDANGTNLFPLMVVPHDSTSVYVALYYYSAPSTPIYGDFVNPSANRPITVESGDTLTVRFRVPILGRQSSINLASEFTQYRSHNGTSEELGLSGSLVPTTTPSGSSETFTLSFPGILANDIFLLEFQAGGVGPWVVGGGTNFDDLRYDGTNYIGAKARVVGSAVVITRGKYAQGINTAWSTISSNSRWRVRKISGGNMAEVPPVVRAEYKNQTTVGAGALKYTSKTEDTHGAYDKTTGVFTCPAAGIYQIGGQVVIGGANYTLTLQKGGVATQSLLDSVYASGMRYNFSTSIRLGLGDQISLSVTGGTASFVDSFIVIERTGA